VSTPRQGTSPALNGRTLPPSGTPGVLTPLRCRLQSVLARLLEHTVGQNERREAPAQSGEAGNLFCGQRPPAVPLAAYLARIFRYANCSPSCYVFAFIYLERLMQVRAAASAAQASKHHFLRQHPGGEHTTAVSAPRAHRLFTQHTFPDSPVLPLPVQNDPSLRITALSVHRLLITAVLVAAKFLDDSYFNNAYYAKVGGISLEEMNALELDFLLRCDFRLHVVPEAFDDVCERLATLLTPEDMEEGLAGDPAVTGAPAQGVSQAAAEEQSDRRAVAFA
jgi:hypothetical protein